MVVWVESHTSQGACAYPITPSTNMGVEFQREVANGRKNLWGEDLAFMELESEHSSASACEGFAAAGGRVTNFTCGQGLILMKEVLYVIAGKGLPMVFHIGARALTSQSLNIHAGHDDVMGVADVGWGMLFAKNAQEVADFALIARRASEDSKTPFFNIQDGFLTTHTVESVLRPEPELMKLFVGDPKLKNQPVIDPYNPIMSGPVQNQDSYMKGKIAQRYFSEKVSQVIEEAMDEFYSLTGRRYGFVEPYKLDDAEYAIVGMGSLAETAMATADYIREKVGIKIGVLNVSVFRPFPGPRIVQALKHLKAFSVLERLDVPLAQSNPLTAEIKASFADALIGSRGYPKVERIPNIFSGSGGLGSRDIRPEDFVAIAENMALAGEKSKEYFVVGINHPLALKNGGQPDVRPRGAFSLRGHSVGGFGSVTTNKIIATILGDIFGLYVQAFPRYGSEKKGLPTNYYLSAAMDRVRTHSELRTVNFVALNDANAFNMGNPLQGLEENGIVFVQTQKETPEELWADIPAYAKKLIAEKRIRLLGMDTLKVAKEVATSPDLIQRMQGIALLGVFLKCTPYQKDLNTTEDNLWQGVEKALRKYFGARRSEQVIRDNMKVVQRGYYEVMEVPRKFVERESPPEGAAR
ncbi:MAG: 2-oxoacid:acceptor oxidoreductase family protein [Chloroflexi bacterium]|nr:2-oxoacid:acceptor oxidoreductase family protein [Chloroflexota bacterium]